MAPVANQKVLIVGAGASGLASIKSCLEEGLEPYCYELTDDIGGLWIFREESFHSGDAHVGSVFKSTVINTSKEMMSFSDFPMPDDWPPYIHNTRVHEYFKMYADKFDLLKHVHLNHKVLSVHMDKDTRIWTAQIHNEKTKVKLEMEFGAVMACTGHHGVPNMPPFKGQDKFEGDILHSHYYKTSAGYEDTKALVIGIGNSGGDAANELSRVCKQVYLSTRRGSWVLNRISDYGIPLDLLYSSLFLREVVGKIVPESYFRNLLNYRFDHEKYGLHCEHNVRSQHPMINDDLPNRIATGMCQVKPDIQEFTDSGVIFTDGTQVEVDKVVMCTGYLFDIPYLPKDVIEVKDNELEAYKFVWPIESHDTNLALIGYVQPLGAIMPIAELQARWACRVFKGDIELPSRSEMAQEVKEYRDNMASEYSESRRHTIQVDYVTYVWDIARKAGLAPGLIWTLMSDPSLFSKLYFGPTLPYFFRLVGSHKWKGARSAIYGAMDRTVNSTKTRKVRSSNNKAGGGGVWKVLVGLCVLVAIVAWLAL